jgi:ABC-type Fe3+-hydroxamate transport system substrate-binding protein
MKAERILSIVLVMMLLASAIPMAVMPAAATYPYEKKMPGDADEDDELTKDELSSAILPYMLGEGTFTLDDVGDAAYVYAYWNGKPRTITDNSDRTVTLYRPIERIVCPRADITKIIIALGECDKLVGCLPWCKFCTCYGYTTYEFTEVLKTTTCAKKVCGGRLFGLPEVGSMSSGIKYPELVISLKPDLTFDRASSADATQEKVGSPVVVISSSGHRLDGLYSGIEDMGIVLEKEEEADELVSFVEEKVAKLEEVTSEISESDKPKVYIATRIQGGGGGVSNVITRTTGVYYPIDIAGGINVAKGISGSRVLKEQIIKWNPDIILVCPRAGVADDPVETVLSDPDFYDSEGQPVINAVKNRAVYPTPYAYCRGTPPDKNLAAAFYLAKLFYPKKCKGLDVEEEGNEIYERFLGVDGLYTEYADLMPWMREFLDKQ